MFLKRIPHKSVRRRELRDRLLLALRVLALMLLAAAFARPFVERVPAAGAALTPRRDLVLLIDRSYSMGYGDRWEQAQAAARATIDGMARDDRAAVVFFDERASVATAQTAETAVLRAALDSARVGTDRTNYGPALRAAQALLDASEMPHREVVLISDFQQNGWDADAANRLGDGIVLSTVPIGDETPANTLIAGVSVGRERFEGRERATITTRIAHRGASSRAAGATLEVDGRAVQTQRFEVEPGAVAEVVFAPLTLGGGGHRAVVRLDEDALRVDDVHNLTLAPLRPVRVLLVDGRGAGAPSSLFLRRALGIGESPAFTVHASAQPTAAELAGTDVVLLNGVPWPAGASGERLETFVRGGGGVLVVLGATGSVPDGVARVAAPVDRTRTGGGALGYVDYAHAALELFREPRNGDLARARYYRYRASTPADSTRVLARFDDGVPALLEARLGAGRMLIVTTTLDTYWSDLPLQPVFLPLLHRLLAWADDWRELPAARTVGDVIELADSIAGRPVVAPDGQPVPGTDTVSVLRVEQPGFYEVRTADGARTARTIAVNVDRTESDLTALQPATIAAAVSPAYAEAGSPAQAGVVLSTVEKERRQSLWWYVLAAALALLAAETVVATRTVRARRPGGAS